MSIVLHWFLPTAGDSHVNVGLGGATGVTGLRADQGRGERAPDLAYPAQIARAAERHGFTGAPTPASSWCEDAWVIASALAPSCARSDSSSHFARGSGLVERAACVAGHRADPRRADGGPPSSAFRAGASCSTSSSAGRRPSGRASATSCPRTSYAHADQFLAIVREVWDGGPADFAGRHFTVEGAQVVPARPWPRIYLGGSSPGAMTVAARLRRLPDLG